MPRVAWQCFLVQYLLERLCPMACMITIVPVHSTCLSHSGSEQLQTMAAKECESSKSPRTEWWRWWALRTISDQMAKANDTRGVFHDEARIRRNGCAGINIEATKRIGSRSKSGKAICKCSKRDVVYQSMKSSSSQRFGRQISSNSQ